MNAHRAYNVLFVDTGNSTRSILAEVIMNRLGAGKFKAYSAGVAPKGEIHPQTMKLLHSLHHSTDNLRSKSWDEFAGADAPQFDFVITVCDEAAALAQPEWAGQPLHSHWSVPDPAGPAASDVDMALAFADAYRMLNNRIGIFVNLPFEKLDALALQERMDSIGGDRAHT